VVIDYYDYMRLQYRIFLSLLMACSVAAQAQNPAKLEPASKNSALDSLLFYQLLLGELNARAEEPGAAFSLILDAARKTNDSALYRRAVQIALQARSGESALQAAKAWSDATPSSSEANRYVLQILLSLNRVAETLEPLKRELLFASNKDRRDVIWAIPASFERASNKQLAASTVQKALAHVLNDPEIAPTAWASVGRMWLSAGDKPNAMSAALKGQSFSAQNEHPALLALALMDPNLPQAEGIVKKHLAHAARPEFRMAYIKTLLSLKRGNDALSELQTLSINNSDYADAWLLQGALSLQSGQTAQAERHFQRYLGLINQDVEPKDQRTNSNRGISQAYLSLAQIAIQRKDFQQADAWLQRVENPEDLLPAQLKRAALIAQQGRVEDAIELIHSLPERSPADAHLKRSAEVQVLRDHRLFDRARTILALALTQNPQDTDLVYDLAMVVEKMGDITEMERLLRQLIALKPDDPHAYNALGYSLADRQLRLPEARQLIAKALELTPADPYITDSLAWVEFRMGNLAEALRLLEEAYAQKPDAEIAAHLGEVLWSLEQRPKAIKTWQEGLKLNAENETLIETLKRLRIKL
jgi:Flp pilus assembly protein TadD